MYSATATESASTRVMGGVCLAIAAAISSPCLSFSAVPERSRFGFLPSAVPRRSTAWQLAQLVSYSDLPRTSTSGDASGRVNCVKPPRRPPPPCGGCPPGGAPGGGPWASPSPVSVTTAAIPPATARRRVSIMCFMAAECSGREPRARDLPRAACRPQGSRRVQDPLSPRRSASPPPRYGQDSDTARCRRCAAAGSRG